MNQIMKTTTCLRLQRGLWGLCGALVLTLAVGANAFAQGENNVQVNVGESVTLAVESVAKIAIADPTIADIVSLSDRELSIIGKKVGATTLTIVRTEGKPTQIFRIDVGNDAAAAVIRKVVGSRTISVRVVGDTLVLDGKVEDELDAQRAALIATAYYKDKVVNLLEISRPRQIKIRTRVAEVSMNAVQHLGLQWFGPAGEVRYSADFISPGAIAGKAFGSSYVSGTSQSQANGGSAQATPTDADIGVDLLLQLLQSKGYARLLSEPTLVTYNGKEASFLVGQQYPIVQQLPQSFTVEFKDVGVRMKIKPTADSENQINTTIHAEVSQVIGTVGQFNIPIIGTKSSDTTLQVKDNQTIIIAGLLENNINNDTLRKLPWLSEIPIFGFLFRNKQYEQQQREVLFFVTPSVIKDVDAETGNAAKTPVMKQWTGAEGTDKVLEGRDKKDDWGMHNFDHMGFPHSDSSPQPSPKAKSASTAQSQSTTPPATNYSPARPTGQ
jgi:pilus assembly protein CpaC